MYHSQITDLLTGRNFTTKETVVAIVIIPNQEMSDPVLEAVGPAGNPSSIYQPISLPMFGTVDSYGDFTPSNDQTSVNLLLQFSGLKTWKEFAETALDYNRGFEYGFENNAHFKKKQTVAGLTLFSMETYSYLCSGQRGRENREKAVTAFAHVLADAAARRNANNETDASAHVLTWLTLCPSTYETVDGRSIDAPSFTETFGGAEVSGLAGPVKNYISMHYEPMKAFKRGDMSQVEQVTSLLDCIYDHHALTLGMHETNLFFAPSKSGYRNSPFAHAGLTRKLLSDTVTEAMYADYPGENYNKNLHAVLEQVRELEEQVQSAMSATSPYSRG